jgi:hypothetical protein
MGLETTAFVCPEIPMLMKIITKSALIQRINRQLAKAGERLRTARSWSARLDCGEYFIVNERNCMLAHDVDIEELGRQLEVIARHERLADDEVTR